MSASLKYRPEIDGLRALAVLPVVAYHLGFRPVPGGFVGVDVFFVISGFLIGRIVIEEALRGDFSVARFYGRRIRRLFPALFVMFAATAAASALILYPVYFEDFGQSLIAAALSVSNLYFYATANYFDSPVDTKPLLHTWSLAVEEQFYVFFPLLVITVLTAARHRLRLALVAAFALSLVWASIAAFTHPEAAFYLPHLRAWELLLGVLLAADLRPRLSSETGRSLVAAGGIALILAPVFLYSHNTVFPGLAALPPCLGTAMVIAAGEEGRHRLSPLLAWWPMVFIGLISYSLYLWHWPLIVLYQQFTGDELIPWPRKLALAGASILLGYLSWRFVETPFRKGQTNAAAVLRAGGFGMAAATIVGVTIAGFNGFPTRFDPDVVRMASYLAYDPDGGRSADSCFLVGSAQQSFDEFDQERCLKREPGRKAILLFGDSHARHLASGLHSRFVGWTIMEAAASACRPYLGASRLYAAPGCNDLVEYLYRDFLPTASRDIDTVLVAARWSRSDLQGLGDSLKALKAMGLKVVLVGPIAQYDASLPQLLARGMQAGDPGLADRHLEPSVPALDREMEALARAVGVEYASAYRALCSPRPCIHLTESGAPIQFDYGHLTREGSSFLIARLFDRDANPIALR